MLEAEITTHAKKRAKQRMKWNKNVLQKMANKALNEGYQHSDTKGTVHRYLTKLWFDHQNANNMRIYGEDIFFFKDNLLITLYRMPHNIIKKAKYQIGK
jgi:hypothetical protein